EMKLYSTPEALDLIQGDFSTTTPLINTVYQITLMDAMKSYYEYIGGSGCGIPSITLTGTTSDWEKIYKDIDGFSEFGLENWVSEVKPILKEFIEASKGNENTEFWQSIYKNVSFYGNSSISGWILKLYPYLRSKIYLDDSGVEEMTGIEETYRPNPYINGKEYLLSIADLSIIPKGYVELNFEWDQYLKTGDTIKNDMLMYGGFIGITQDGKSMAVKPHIAWAICRKEIPASFEEPDVIYGSERNRNEFEHKITEWLVRPRGSVDSSPVYNPDKNNTSLEGIEEFKKELRSSGLMTSDSTKITLMISWHGEAFVSEIEGYSKESVQAIYDFVLDKLKLWYPAQVKGGGSQEDRNALIPTNMRIVLTI
ncbi:MAG: DUF4419 domain-containing protein, partial [Crocinitomicaceae bacterium]|nr:DUF4419 domain-containing protein [Crocinitomicaceae bacterium]